MMSRANRRSAFLAEHKRQPTKEEALQLVELEREDRRAAEAERHETELRRAFMSQPDASEESWEKERAGLLAADRLERTAKARESARAAQSRMYRSF
jgi:hypothetical protein